MVPGKPTTARTSAGVPFTVTSTGEFTEASGVEGNGLPSPTLGWTGPSPFAKTDKISPGAAAFVAVTSVPLVNSDQLDKLEFVALQSFAFRTCSNGLVRLPRRVLWSRAALQLEILVLRHQLGVLQRSVKRPKLRPADRVLWAWLSSVWTGWESRVSIVKAATVIGWQRKGFGLFWSWKIRHGKRGRPAVPKHVRQLIRMLSRENPLWGAPHLHGELLKLGIIIGETSVTKYMVRHRKPPS